MLFLAQKVPVYFLRLYVVAYAATVTATHATIVVRDRTLTSTMHALQSWHWHWHHSYPNYIKAIQSPLAKYNQSATLSPYYI